MATVRVKGLTSEHFSYFRLLTLTEVIRILRCEWDSVIFDQ